MYPTIIKKDAAIAEIIIINHPIIDGNKRTGFLAMLAILENEHFQLNTENDEIYNFTIKIPTGEFKFKQIVAWLKSNTTLQ